jgi:cytochrome c-type biogenesis protein CcmF
MSPTYLFGNYSLCAAVIVAAGTLLVSLAAVRFGDPSLRRTARTGILILAGLLTLSACSLVAALVNGEFAYRYVAKYTERALPLGYKLAAFWAGQEGSLLLWAWVLAAMSAIFVVVYSNEEGEEHSAAVGLLAAVIGFFAVLMVFAANPFTTTKVVPADGNGLNPMLQDPGMIAHPPILFVGYAGFTVPFALALGALVVRRTDHRWVELARPWAMVSWIFLGAGILLGAEWAYVELGWGGYWAWDPVENASLLPWLTGTALLHSFMAQRQRGMFKRWNVVLAALTFILCVFGTYVTRSGVVDSVHTFGKSLVGDICLGFLIIIGLVSVVTILIRWSALRPEHRIENWFSREGTALAGIVLLVAMMLVTTIGTMFPAITRAVTGQSMSVTTNFYNRAVLPMALALFGLMAVGPLLSYGGQIGKRLGTLVLPIVLAGATMIGLLALGIRSTSALATGVVTAAVAGAVIADVVTGLLVRSRNTGESIWLAAWKLLGSNYRRYAAHVVHTGIVMVAVGVAGSSLYAKKELVQLSPGQTVKVGHVSLTLAGFDEQREANFTAYVADVVMMDRDGSKRAMSPQFRRYDKYAEQLMREVAIRSNWRDDVYVTLAAADPNSGQWLVTFEVLVNPLVKWIWAGGVVLTAGALLCLIPRRAGHKVTAPVQIESPAHLTPRPARSRKPRRREQAVHAGD